MSHIRAVTFDCWGTLITDTDLTTAMDVRTRTVAEICAERLPADKVDELLRRAWQEHHRSWLAGVQYGAPGIARFCMTELAWSDDLVCDRIQEAIEEAGRHGELEALPGAARTLRTLREAGIRTALVCDTGLTPGRIVRDFLDDVGVLEHLEFCAFSNEVGSPKPHPEIFHAALEAVDTPPNNAVHVGDLLRTDIHGGRAVGMRTIRITAVNDDSSSGFSWDPDATFTAQVGEGTTTVPAPFDDADEVVGSHAEIPDALRRLGAALP